MEEYRNAAIRNIKNILSDLENKVEDLVDEDLEGGDCFRMSLKIDVNDFICESEIKKSVEKSRYIG